MNFFDSSPPPDLLGNADPNKVVTEADFNLTVDFDSELEDSLGPDYMKTCIDPHDSDYDAEATKHIQDRDYKGLDNDFWEYKNEGMQRIFGYHIVLQTRNTGWLFHFTH